MRQNRPDQPLLRRLSPTAFGLCLAVLTILFGQGLGVLFGLNEEAVKSRLHDDAIAVEATMYQNDEGAMKAVLDKSWTYMKRAHLHASSLGVTAVALVLLVIFLTQSAWTLRLISLALGFGGLGYSIFWMWAGFRAPGMGGTGPAKESLSWLAIPTSGLFVAATVAVLLLLLYKVIRHRPGSHFKEDEPGS